jgi:hypothetical protein
MALLQLEEMDYDLHPQCCADGTRALNKSDLNTSFQHFDEVVHFGGFDPI